MLNRQQPAPFSQVEIGKENLKDEKKRRELEGKIIKHALQTRVIEFQKTTIRRKLISFNFFLLKKKKGKNKRKKNHLENSWM